MPSPSTDTSTPVAQARAALRKWTARTAMMTELASTAVVASATRKASGPGVPPCGAITATHAVNRKQAASPSASRPCRSRARNVGAAPGSSSRPVR